MQCCDPTSAFQDIPSVAWHLVWQAAEGRDLLAHPALAERIRARLLDAHRAPGRALLHYLILPGEIHLLSRLPPDSAPGDIARAVGNIVARWVREAQERPGNVFAGRFRAYAIDSDDALRDEIRMLAWRPVVLGLCRAPTHHATSALRAVLGLRRPLGFDTLAPLRLFGDSVSEARGVLRAALARRPGPIDVHQWALTRGLARASDPAGTFAALTRSTQGLAAALVAAGQPPGIGGALGLLERWVRLKLGVREGGGAGRPTPAAAARERALVACLAMQLHLCSASAVARHFQRAKATLSERMAACKAQAEDRALLATPPARLVAEAIGLRDGGRPTQARDRQGATPFLASKVERAAP